MPLYDYYCSNGHLHEERRGYEESSIPCGSCKAIAHRVILEPPFVITESGSVNGPADRNRRTSTGEKLEQLRKTSVETKRQTGKVSGPFQIRDWER